METTKRIFTALVFTLICAGSIFFIINNEYPGLISRISEKFVEKAEVKTEPLEKKMVCTYFGQIQGDSIFMIKSDLNSLKTENGMKYSDSFTAEIGIPPRQITKLTVLEVFQLRSGTTIVVADTLAAYNELFKRRVSMFVFPSLVLNPVDPKSTINTFREREIKLLPCPDAQH